MSWICGIVNFDDTPVLVDEIHKMLDAMPNKNNDGEGTWTDGHVGFGHKALWTTPESLYENQPIISQNGNLALTADARIDNRKELIEKLDLYKTEIITDADLILYSYEKWNEDCPKYLMGDFSFALWDKVHNKLFMSRDRFSNKPFYFYLKNKNLYFSSSIDVLQATSDKPFSVNTESIKLFGRFATVKYEETMYNSILRIPPAHSFVFSTHGMKKYRYWFPEKIKINYKLSFEEAKKNVAVLLQNAVESRLRIYGDFACELSGGLDSTVISLLAKDITKMKFKTFSMRYQSYSCDEWKYTKEAIDKLGCTSIVLDIDKLDVSNKYHLLKSVQLNNHWPLYGSFIHNYALGEKMIESDIRVCLTGHGGDHVFTGNFDPILDYMKNLRFKYALEEFVYSNENIFRYFYRMAKSFLPQKIKLVLKKYLFGYKLSGIMTPENFTDYWNLFSIKSDSVRSNLYAIAGRQHVTHTDNNHYRILESIGNIEFRHPFFDTQLVEYLLTLPNYYKYKQGTIKVVLREAMKNLYPDAIYQRKDKSEFSEALLAQMNEMDMEKIFDNPLLEKYHLIDNSLYENLLRQYDSNNIDAEGVGNLWRLTTLELWLKENLME